MPIGAIIKENVLKKWEMDVTIKNNRSLFIKSIKTFCFILWVFLSLLRLIYITYNLFIWGPKKILFVFVKIKLFQILNDLRNWIKPILHDTQYMVIRTLNSCSTQGTHFTKLYIWNFLILFLCSTILDFNAVQPGPKMGIVLSPK